MAGILPAERWVLQLTTAGADTQTMDADTSTSPADEHQHQQPAPRNRRTERGASLVEYALLVALIAVVAIAGVAQFGTAIRDSDMKSITSSI